MTQETGAVCLDIRFVSLHQVAWLWTCFFSGYLCLNTRGNTSVRGFFLYDMHMTWAAQAMDSAETMHWTQPPFLSVQKSRWA